MKTYWLVWCVLLFYNDMCWTLLTIQNKVVLGRKGENAKDTTGATCNDWEEYDGVECVCANSKTARCTQKGGLVCDDKGSTYKSMCHFALQMCNSNISFKTSLQSCGACETLRLRRENSFSEGETLMYFRRKGIDKGYKTEYVSTGGEIGIFFDETISLWVIGIKNKTGTYASMIQEIKSPYPQDSEGGMLVVSKHGSNANWTTDITMQLECVSSMSYKQDKDFSKRFIFTLIFTVVAVVATVTTTALKVVQSKKGCLYYPSVCRMRDEIKYKLRPQVKALKSSFISTYGDPIKIKSEAEEVQDGILKIQQKLVKIKALHTKLDSTLSALSTHASSLPDKFPDIASYLTTYKDWHSGVRQGAKLSIVLTYAEIYLTVAFLPSMIATASSAFTIAMAGLGAVLAVGFAVVDIITSVNQERKIRDRLRKSRSTLIKARNDFENAFKAMKKFQKSFCNSVVMFLRELYGKTQYKLFKSLNSKLRKIYGYSKSCTHVFSKTNLTTLRLLNREHVKPLLKFLSQNVSKLEKKLLEVEQLHQIFKTVLVNVKAKKHQPSVIFENLKMQTPIYRNVFPNLFIFLKYIAEKILADVECYWGHHLQKIRKEIITEKNYLHSPVCMSPEINETMRIIKEMVNKGDIPCSISRRVLGTVFRNRNMVMTFIAKYVLPRSRCYWGYDLKSIREYVSATMIENAKITSALFTSLRAFEFGATTKDTLKTIRRTMCATFLVCNEGWQSFIMCATWKSKSWKEYINCKDLPLGNKCIPSVENFQSCS